MLISFIKYAPNVETLPLEAWTAFLLCSRVEVSTCSPNREGQTEILNSNMNRWIRSLPIVLAMFAVGRPGDPDDFPQSAKEQEEPSGRKPARELIC